MTCYPDKVWGVYIPPAQQISVQQGDMIGIFSEKDYTLQMTNCNGYNDNTWSLVGASVASFTDVSTASFNITSCAIPSVAYRISSSGGQR